MKKDKKRRRTIAILISVCVFAGAVLIGLGVYLHLKPENIEFLEGAEAGVDETAGFESETVSTNPDPDPDPVVDRESPKISFAGHLETAVGNEIDLLKGVSAADNSGEDITVTVEGLYDIHTVGDYQLTYVAYDSSLNKAEEPFILSVVDHESPVITFTSYLEISVGNEIDLLEGVSVSDNSGEDITVTVEGSYDVNQAGTYELKLVAYDSSRNKAEEKLTLRVKDAASPSAGKTGETEIISFVTSKGFQGEVRDGVTYIDGCLIANKSYSLPEDYGSRLTDEMQSAFSQMQAGAKADGLSIYIVSGFRSYSYQEGLYNRYVSRDGVAEADTYSARAGHSEHQSGLAADLNSTYDSFANTREGIWLANNCYKYGFILRYPKGKSDETGYKYEPWHFRYVGTELAEKLYNDGDWITVEDYFGITSKYQ